MLACKNNKFRGGTCKSIRSQDKIAFCISQLERNLRPQETTNSATRINGIRTPLRERKQPNRGAGVPALPLRFLEPPGFVWGSLSSNDGAQLRWGHLPAKEPRAECVMVGGFGECIEKYFETIGDLAARGYSMWCLDWRGQGGSARPRRLPSRPTTQAFRSRRR